MEKLTRKEINEYNMTLDLYGMKYCNITNSIQPKDSFKNGHSWKARKLYNIQNKKGVSQYNKEYYELNPNYFENKRVERYKTEKFQIWRRNYVKENSEDYLNRVNRRRLKEKDDFKSLSKEEQQLILNLYKECKRLTLETGAKYEVDHKIPLSKGGKHHYENLQILTRIENRKKYNKI
jgi:5-methylcytosine-specific restriction endonuclease McrA